MERLIKDLRGQRFGRLTVLAMAERRADGKIRWECVCECNNKVVVRGDDLRSGNSRSCCLPTGWSAVQGQCRSAAHGRRMSPET